MAKAKKKHKKKAKKKVQKKRGEILGTAMLRDLDVVGVKHKSCRRGRLVLEYAHDSASAILTAYEVVRRKRGAKRGMTTDAEQDLLRAMLVMAAAGLDGMAKQLIRDALPVLIKRDPEVQEGLEKFVARQIRGDADTPEVVTGAKFLARVLAAPSQQKQVIEEYIRELTGGSLQSAEELVRTAAAFGLQMEDVGIDRKKVKEIFEVRNKIIHELDIDLEGERRKRNLRRQHDMTAHVDTLLGIAERMLVGVNRKLATGK